MAKTKTEKNVTIRDLPAKKVVKGGATQATPQNPSPPPPKFGDTPGLNGGDMISKMIKP
jgi:hypothetical protein